MATRQRAQCGVHEERTEGVGARRDSGAHGAGADPGVGPSGGCRHRERNADGCEADGTRGTDQCAPGAIHVGRRCFGSTRDECVGRPSWQGQHRRCLSFRSLVSENRYCGTASRSGNECCINFDWKQKKDWTLLRNSCITIKRRSETPLPKFEECLQRLEKIVQELEKGEVPLETSLTLFEEGMQLSSSCRKELEQAEGKVEILLKKNGKLQAEPFEALTEKSPARR